LARAANSQQDDLGIRYVENNAIDSTPAGPAQRLTKLAAQRMGFGRLGKILRRRGYLPDGMAEGQLSGNRTLRRSMREPVENVVHIRSGTPDDPKRSAHGLGRQVVPFPQVAVELIERNAVITLRHVVERFLNRGKLFDKCGRLRVQPSPFIKSFFRGQVDSVGPELVGEKAVELAKFFNHFGRHDLLLCCS
jgi:hypothetical protein